MQLQGPNGQVALVDDEGRLFSFAVSEPEDKHLNKEGGVYSAYFTSTPVGANDYFFYIRNDGVTNLFLTDIRISASAPATIYYESVSGTPVFTAETPITPISRNLGSPRALTAKVSADTDTTGITSNGVIFFEKIKASDTRYKLSTTSTIIIPQGKAVAFRASASVDIECVVSIVDGVG